MNEAGTEQEGYTSQRICEALAQDERVGELGLEVYIDDVEVSVSGKVMTEQRRMAVGTVINEILPGAAIRNKVIVVPTGPPDVEIVP